MRHPGSATALIGVLALVAATASARAEEPCAGEALTRAVAVTLPPEAPSEPSVAGAAALWHWVRRETGLPEGTPAPSVAFADGPCLAHLRHGPSHSGPFETEALYLADTATVLMRHRWAADTAAGRSVLVHEFVHHAQAVAGARFACPAAAEAEAYALQAKWLAARGLDLAEAFGLDRMTLFVLTRCGI